MTYLQAKTAPYITETVRRLQNAGYEAYIVGGAVRDFLLDRVPKDYDLSTSATPEQIKAVFKDRRCIIIGKRFRLVHLYHGKNNIMEISTFRKRPQTAPHQDARPKRAQNAPEHMIFHDNEFGSAQEDAQRRDFTVNAIFYDPVRDTLLDYTENGLEDIRHKRVRIIGSPELRFEEDPVRILRALKLVGQYGFGLEKETEKALRRCMPLILHASISRLTLELEKILKNSYGHKIIQAFREYGFLKYFLPYMDQHYDTPQMEYAMSLLECRNKRLQRGIYRDSISLVLSLFTLAFAEKKFENNPPGGLWSFYNGIEPELKSLILELFHPHILTKRSSIAAMKHLLLQTRLKSGGSHRYIFQHGYPTARELALIQNEVLWRIPDFEQLCPPAENFMEKAKKERRIEKRKRQKERRVETHRQTESGTAAFEMEQRENEEESIVLGF